MLVRELLQRLENGETLRTLALEVGVNPSTGLQRKMKRLGYEYDKSEKVWRWGGEGDQPLDADLSTEVATTRRQPSDNKKVKKTTTKVVGDEMGATSKKQHGDNLTADELVAIREIIARFADQQRESAPTIEDNVSVHDLLRGLDRDRERVRRNVFLGADTNKKLNEFCKTERVHMSDITEIALIEFLSRRS